MTDAGLDQIEAALGITLPAEYRQVSRAFPFQPLGNDWIYWFYDDPERVIGETKMPLDESDYAGIGWRRTFLVIGESGSGDRYLLDTADAASPVYLLSHETREIAVEWPSLAAFVVEWVRAPAEWQQRQEAERAALRAWWRQAWIITAIIVLFAFVVPLLVLLLAP